MIVVEAKVADEAFHRTRGVGGWRDGPAVKSTQVRFSAPTPFELQLPVTLVPMDLMFSAGLCGQCTHIYIPLYKQTHIYTELKIELKTFKRKNGGVVPTG